METPKSLKNKIIVDPYKELDKSNTKLLQKMKFPIETEKEKNWMMYGDGSFHSGGNRHIFIYLLPASVAAYYIEIDKDESNFIKQSLSAEQKEVDEQRPVLAYFDKGLFKNGVCQPQNSGYLCLGYGKHSISEREHLDGWIEVPRLFFSGINDYVYLAVSCVNEPQIHVSSFPENQPFFWDLPVASSIYNDQLLSESKIIPGTAKMITKILDEENIYYRRRIYAEKTLKVEYSWQKTGRRSDYAKLEDGTICKKLLRLVKCTTQDGEYNASVSLPVYVYNRNRNGITAFVWHSGNEDDVVKKSSVGYNEGEEDKFYNKYRYLLDSLSLETIYGSFASLTKITEEAAARYIVRSLAHQPEGYRSVSVEGHLVYLMGGALYRIKKIVDSYKGVRSPGDTSSHKGEELLSEEDLLRVQALFKINNSLLRYDSKVAYENIPNADRAAEIYNEEKHFVKDVLGIPKGSSGCKRMQSLIRRIFRGIADLGITIDYVYCDIEYINNEARAIAVNRFCPQYLKALNGKDKEDKTQKNIYDNLYSEIESDSQFLRALQSLSYVPNGVGLNSIMDMSLGDKGLAQKYGITNYKSYAERRNLNVWDVVMKNYTNSLFYNSIFAPIQVIFPDAKCSSDSRYILKGYLNRAEEFETYLGGNVNLYGKMYSSLPLYGEHMTNGYKKLNMDNWNILPVPSLFSFFMDSINRLRVVALSSKGKFNVFITTWNIWAFDINKILEFRLCDNEGNLIKQSDDDDDEVKAYHRELLYHTFLMNPDKAIAYFNLDKTVKDKKHYINLESEDGGYFKYAYNELNEILTDINKELGHGIIIPQTDMLAVETEPYVLSCAEVNNKWIWRLTVDRKTNPQPNKKEKGVVSFNVDGRQITFNNVEEFSEGEGIGFWIITPPNIIPKILTEQDYYGKHSAITISDISFTERENVLDIIDYTAEKNPAEYVRLTFPYNRYTILGDMPSHHSVTMKFRVTDVLESDCRLLDLGILRNSKNKLYLFILGKKNDGTINFSLKEGSTIHNVKTIKKGELYELKLRIDITHQDESMVSGNFYYALNVINNSTVNYDQNWSEPYPWNYSISHADYCYANNISLWHYCNRPDCITHKENLTLKEIIEKNIKEELTSGSLKEEDIDIQRKKLRSQYFYDILEEVKIRVENFSIHAHGHQEKVELFRESNGLNISRVNKSIAAYRLNTWEIHDSPVEVENENIIDETIIGKFSWLNACECKVRYKLTYSLFDEKGDEISLGDQERPSAAANIIYPLDGRLKLIKVSYKNVIFEVEPQSEGYMLVKLLNCYSKSAKIKWSLYKLEDGDSGTENLLHETSIRIVDIIRNYSCDKKIASINLFKKNGETNYKTKQI